MFREPDKGLMFNFVADMCGRGGCIDSMAQLCNFKLNGNKRHTRSFTIHHGPKGTKLNVDAANLVDIYYVNKAKRLLKLETTSDFNISSSSCGMITQPPPHQQEEQPAGAINLSLRIEIVFLRIEIVSMVFHNRRHLVTRSVNFWS